MLTDPKLRSQVDALWDKFWTGGLSNPLDAIDQFSFLLFLKRLDDRENAAERQAKRKGDGVERWSVVYGQRSPLAGVVVRAVTEPVEVSRVCVGGCLRRGSPFEARRWRGCLK